MTKHHHGLFANTSSAKLVHSSYGRNRASGIVWRRDHLAHAMNPEVKTQDNGCGYDGLQQVTRHERGYLEPSATPPPIYSGIDPATRQQREDFTFDETGNWTQYRSATPTTAWTQDRVNNTSNQIDSLTGPTGVIQPAYDKAGNMTTMPKAGDWTTANVLTWDAWNRPVKLTEGSAQTGYAYDALTRRTIKTTAAETRNYYYNNQWRAIEERVSGAVKAAYVWSPIDRWTMIRRKRSVTGALDETRYVLKDYLDPVAIIDTDAIVIERYGYEAFGPVRIMDPDFTTRTASACAWNFLFHAEFLDLDSGLYNYGFRYYNPDLGMWPSRDPISERGGVNLYVFAGNSAIYSLDYLGMEQDCTSSNIGAKKTELAGATITPWQNNGEPYSDRLQIGSELLNSINSLSNLMTAGNIAAGAAQGMMESGAYAVAGGTDRAASTGLTGNPIGTGITAAGENALRQIGKAIQDTANSNNAWGRGGMIIVKYRCCVCRCRRYLWGLFSTSGWSCGDELSKSYIIDDEDGAVYDFNSPTPNFRRGLDKMTGNDVSAAVSQLESEACK